MPEDFEVELSSTGQRLMCRPQPTLLAVLQAHGVSMRASCETGICGSCICDYTAGEVIHRDAVLQLAEALAPRRPLRIEGQREIDAARSSNFRGDGGASGTAEPVRCS